MIITVQFTELEKQTICNVYVCNHLKKHWKGYKEIVYLSGLIKSVDGYREEELWDFVEGRVREAVNHVGLEDLTKAKDVNANEEGLIRVFIKLFMLLDDYGQPPTQAPGGTKGC